MSTLSGSVLFLVSALPWVSPTATDIRSFQERRARRPLPQSRAPRSVVEGGRVATAWACIRLGQSSLHAVGTLLS